MIKVRDLHFSYNGIEVLRGINFKAGTGEFIAILGPNGAGKSTFVKCLAGIVRCNGVEILGRPIGEYSPRELARIVAYVPQRVGRGFMTVFDTVLLGRRPYMGLTPSREDLKTVENALRRLGIEHLALKKTNDISGGELQKVSIARALAQEPRILILDEPTNNLDLKSQLEVMKLAREFSSEGRTVIMVVHDINLALRFAHRFVFITEGTVVAEGTHDVLSPDLFKRVYGTDVEIGKVRGIPVVVPL
ncbi:ABC transporter ATP-binding protein [Thermococcus sp. Bubb.Bath]|uniref:ABC transporter ATP-binding protein n=1 Tax=Thermococcus sp. Bubb.Bath TaxID=1638242 RepID=UPI00143A90BE|nr:ABC transporter ATP-binding protein [Thermococcus sp. Bubb.Bath]NJF25779.1 ABC transporter ATP-binding protein [Thermococcus sp. Bubb.Bath]